MPIQHITELFALDGEEFVTEAYRNLLKREPDAHGLAYYLGRLAAGYGKAAVITQMAKSPECRVVDEIKGLKALMIDEGRARHWLWAWFTRRSRLERALQSGIAGLAQVTQRLASLQAQQKHSLARIEQQMISLTQQIAQSSAAALQQEKNTEEARLPAQTVRQLFIEILGREPDSEDVIEHHAKLPSVQALREALINSEEFQSRVRALPEYARTIFQRQIQAYL